MKRFLAACAFGFGMPAMVFGLFGFAAYFAENYGTWAGAAFLTLFMGCILTAAVYFGGRHEDVG